MAEQLVPAALDAMKPLRKAQNAIARARAELAERRDRLRLKQADQTNVVAALERQEIRTWLRSLDQAQRDKLFLGGGERVTPAIAEAVMTAPPALSGVAPSNINLMKERALEAQFPGEIEALADMERAIEVTERAVNVNTTEILNEMGIMKEKLLELAEPVLREVDTADAAEFARTSSRANPIPNADQLCEQIKTLPYEERSRFIDVALNENFDQLISGQKK